MVSDLWRIVPEWLPLFVLFVKGILQHPDELGGTMSAPHKLHGLHVRPHLGARPAEKRSTTENRGDNFWARFMEDIITRGQKIIIGVNVNP